MRLQGLYLITDRGACADRPIADVVQQALAGGLKLLQYREKSLSRRDAYAEATVLREMTRASGAVFIINDDIDLALAVEADGVHLGQEDMPLEVARRILGSDRVIGISARDRSAVRAALDGGADYIAIGPIYASKTKQVVAPLGFDLVRAARAMTERPIFGIGGIDHSNAAEVIRAGADGVAVISAVHDRPDVAAATRDFIRSLQALRKWPEKRFE